MTTKPQSTTEDAIEREFDHFSIVPFKAVCGADRVGQSTTQDPRRAKCAICWQYWKEWESSYYFSVRVPAAGTARISGEQWLAQRGFADSRTYSSVEIAQLLEEFAASATPVVDEDLSSNESIRCSCGDITCNTCDAPIPLPQCPECGHDYVGRTPNEACRARDYAPDDPTICACENSYHATATAAPVEQSLCLHQCDYGGMPRCVLPQGHEGVHDYSSGAQSATPSSTSARSAAEEIADTYGLGHQCSALAAIIARHSSHASHTPNTHEFVGDSKSLPCGYCGFIYSAPIHRHQGAR